MIMKRIYIIAMLIAMTAMSVSAQAVKFFEKYEDADDVTSVYVSKAILRMMPDISTGDMDFSGVSGKIECIRVLTADRAEIAGKLRTDADKVIKEGKYELLVKVSEGKEKTNIYMKSDKEGMNEYIILNGSPNDFNAILIEGTLTPADVQKMAKKK